MNPLTALRRFDPPLSVGVLSDTHIHDGSHRAISGEVFALLERAGCGLILHAGDCNNLGTLERLAEIAPVLAVSGNNDVAEVQEVAPRKLTFKVGKAEVGLVHGHGGVAARAVAQSTFGRGVGLVVYGHSHKPMIEKIGGVTYFNPGSPTDRRWHEHFGIGLIHFTEAGFRPELLLFESPAELSAMKTG